MQVVDNIGEKIKETDASGQWHHLFIYHLNGSKQRRSLSTTKVNKTQ